jgi:hypothetical protein
MCRKVRRLSHQWPEPARGGEAHGCNQREKREHARHQTAAKIGGSKLGGYDADGDAWTPGTDESEVSVSGPPVADC